MTEAKFKSFTLAIYYTSFLSLWQVFFIRFLKNRKRKKPKAKPSAYILLVVRGSDRSRDLAGTQAARAGVNSARGTVNDRLHSLYVGLPGSVGPSVGMGNLDTELHVFAAKIAFCHVERTSFDYWTINKLKHNSR